MRRTDFVRSRAWVRAAALAGIVAAGLISIVGSGGGVDAPECSFFSDVCDPGDFLGDLPPLPMPPQAAAAPPRQAVQAGSGASFSAQAAGVDLPRYQWQRSDDAGANFVDIAGATGSMLTLANAQRADDGAAFRWQLRSGSNDAVQATSNAVTLLVSSQPALVFEDGDFAPADWSASAIADPSQDGPSHSENLSDTGGLPGAFRHMVHTMTAGPSSLRVFNLRVSAAYDPQALGAIHAIDYREDCSLLGTTSAAFNVFSFAIVEQAGRRYASSAGRGCLSKWVGNFDPIPTLRAADFVQVDGPACGPNEACPDFSAAGAPLHFGFERRVSAPAGLAAGSIEHGIDNWKFTVWRP